jgi:hypothetical protein
MPIPNSATEVAEPTATDKLEAMASMGEIELTPEEPATDPDPTPQGQPDRIVLRGKEYSEEEVLNLLDRGRNAQNDENWQARNTQKSMQLAEEKRQLEAEKAKIKEEYDTMRKTAEGDPVQQRMIDLLEMQRNENLQLKRNQDALANEIQRQKDVSFILDQKAKAESVLGEKLPDYGTPEFQNLIDLAANGNRLEMAFRASKATRPIKPLPNVRDTDIAPRGPDMSSEMQQAINASGLDPELVKSLM